MGDAVYPQPQWLDYPGLLDLPHPKRRACRPETTIAEKLHANFASGYAHESVPRDPWRAG